MKRSRLLDPFTFRFCDHLRSFGTKHCLWDSKDTEFIIALSGGLDSMALLKWAELMKRQGRLNKVRAVHINHQVHHLSDQCEQFLRSHCQRRSIDLRVLTIPALWRESVKKNESEVHWRRWRYRLLNQYLKKREQRLLANRTGPHSVRLALAHHIDDSYEWSLMQSARSSNRQAQLGIPLLRGQIIRPFMCVTKDQIARFASINKVICFEDPSNEDTRFERNYLRQGVIPLLRKRYPKMLKHYTHTQNQRAHDLGVHRLDRLKVSQKEDNLNGNIYHLEQASIFWPSTLEDSYQNRFKLECLVRKHSISDRGVLAKQLSKVFEGLSNGKKGPLVFSGGVYVHLFKQCVWVGREAQRPTATHIPKEGHSRPLNAILNALAGDHGDNTYSHSNYWVWCERVELKQVAARCIGSSEVLENKNWPRPLRDKDLVPILIFDLVFYWKKMNKVGRYYL